MFAIPDNNVNAVAANEKAPGSDRLAEYVPKESDHIRELVDMVRFCATAAYSEADDGSPTAVATGSRRRKAKASKAVGAVAFFSRSEMKYASIPVPAANPDVGSIFSIRAATRDFICGQRGCIIARSPED